GEMRDLETTSAAITAAETGHLVFGTLHTTGSARTVDRIIDQYPTNQQEQIRAQLAVSIVAVLSQVLLPRADRKGRIAAFEIMYMNSAIENHIRKAETFKINSAIQTSKRQGMVTLDDYLRELVEDGKITPKVAIEASQEPREMEKRLLGEG
ncbi:MAG: ATPase, T2SS/T4P/T4SS family, partial [Planctomycetota bacterium]|nr:ATPase, T2SS/T4P/T4SS family [Planctomycetota bacterium]